MLSPFYREEDGTSLVVQWLRLCASDAGGTGSIPGRGTKIPHAVQHGSPAAPPNEEETEHREVRKLAEGSQSVAESEDRSPCCQERWSSPDPVLCGEFGQHC